MTREINLTKDMSMCNTTLRLSSARKKKCVSRQKVVAKVNKKPIAHLNVKPPVTNRTLILQNTTKPIRH